MAVTTVSNSLILGGWVTKVLKNRDKKWEGGRMGDNNILTVLSYCSRQKNATFLFTFTRVCLFFKLKKLHFGQFFLFVFVKFRNKR